MKRALAAALLMSSALWGGAVRTNAAFNRNSIPRNDDGSGPLTPLGFTVNFFGKTRTSVYVNNNGNVTFDNALATFTPFGLENTHREIIAPFFADVDTRPLGSKLVTYGTDTVNGRPAFGVNYVDVGYYNVHADKLNSFQLVLIDRSDLGTGNFDIEFNYDRITWETGDASGGVNGFGGVPAAVGYSNGTGDPGTSFELEGSLISGSFLDRGPHSLVRNRLNNTQPGRFIFRARNGQILPPLSITSSCPLPNASVNRSYAQQFFAAGGGTNLRWMVLPDPGATLPAGVNFSGDGKITGTPTSAGSTPFTVQLTATTEDGDQTVSKRCSLTVDAPVLAITTACPLPPATTGQRYSRSLQVNGGRAPYTWSTGDGSDLNIPGLSLSSSGIVSGTPFAAGTYVFSIKVNGNPADGSQPATKFCSLTVNVGASNITSGCTLPAATAGVPYSQGLQVDGGVGPYFWTLSGALPRGLSFSSDGTISGVPLSASQNNFSTIVTDAAGNRSTSTCSISVNSPLFNVATSCPLPGGTTGTAYSQQLSAGGGIAPYSWSLFGSLPPGLSLSSGGVISGNPMTAGLRSFRLVVTDNSGASTATQCTMNVSAAAFALNSCPLPPATVSVPYYRSVQATGGVEPYIFSTDRLPPGLILNTFGLLSGTPTTSGTFPMSIQILDSQGMNTTQPCSLTVNPSPVTISDICPLPVARLGSPYSARFTASGGTPPYQFNASGLLPDGLSLGVDGSLSGAPRRVGDSTFYVSAADSQGRFTTTDCSVSVRLPDAPGFLMSSFPDTFNPASAGPTVILQLAQPYSLPVTGQLVLTQTADTGNAEGTANQPDPRVRFSNGQTVFNFTIPAGGRQVSTSVVSTGTVASTVTVQATNLTAGGAPVTLAPPPKAFRVLRLAPVVTDACYNVKPTGVEAVITGYSTTRSLTAAQFSFIGTGGDAQHTQTQNVDISGSSLEYFLSDDSVRNGGAFTLTIPFTSEGTTISGATFTISNSQGTTAAKQINRCQ